MLKRTLFIAAIALICATTAAAQQDKSQRLSPPAQAQCKLADGKTITVNYSSPRVHDPKTHEVRKIMGGLVPYGQVWRTGANEATTFVTGSNLTVGGKDVPAGNYTIFTVPTPDSWTLIINKHIGEWGIPYKYESEELARVPMSVSSTSGPVENFTISFDQSGGACTLQLSWENTQALVKFAEK
jgi:hypothetical protein